MKNDRTSHRPQPRTPAGFRDLAGRQVLAGRAMLERICAVYELHGFQALETPALEYTDALGKFLPDVDRPGAGVFSLQDEDDRWMSLRYDLTAPLARFVAENRDGLPRPFCCYQAGPVWRNEKPGPGRYRQFTQCDADIVGAHAPDADVECVAMLGEVMEAAGVERGGYRIHLNDRHVLTGLLELAGIDEKRDHRKKTGVLRAMDKFDRLGEEGVRSLLGKGRRDASGDYTEGAGLDAKAIDRIMEFMTLAGDDSRKTCDMLSGLIGSSASGAHGVEVLSAMISRLRAFGMDDRSVKIDLSVIRGLEYYTGPVFETMLLSRNGPAGNIPSSVGSVASGGRYDGLVSRFGGPDVPAAGISVGISRLLAALEMRDGIQPPRGPVVVLALEKDRMESYHVMARELRTAGIRAGVYLGGSGFGRQLKYADRCAAPVAVICGEDERKRGEVTVKNLVLGAALSKGIEDNTTWRKEQPAQFSVRRESMVEAVRSALESPDAGTREKG